MKRPALWLWFGIGLLFAGAIKSFFSRAGAEELAWILAPACWLVERVSGIELQREAGAGWISHTHRMIVSPGCAGVNFLVIAFLAFFFHAVHRVERSSGRLLCLVGSLLAAWALTITTNASRIILVASLYPMEIYGGILTPARVHRAAGTAVYCVSLVLACLTMERIGARFRGGPCAGRTPSPFVPLAWYLGVMVGVPALTGAWRNRPGLFLEHSVFVVAVCTLVALAGAALRRHRPAAGATAPRG